MKNLTLHIITLSNRNVNRTVNMRNEDEIHKSVLNFLK
jgi:hypothetical protein